MAELDFEATEVVIKQYGVKAISEIIAKLKKYNKSASGRLINSLTYSIVDTVEGILAQIKGEDYFEYIESGRKPGRIPPITPLLKWVRLKGLPEASAYAIAKKIGKFGIKPRPILSEVIEENKFAEGTELEEALSTDIENYIEENIIQNKK